MANPARGGAPICKCIAITILTIIGLVGLVILITWLAVRPKLMVYMVEDGSIHGFNLKKDHLNATFNFTLRSHTPNVKVSVYYDSIEASVKFDDQTIASGGVEPFFQPYRNVTRLEVKPVARSLPLLRSTSKDLRRQSSSGEIEVDVEVKAMIRFKVGKWKSSERTLRVLCSPVVVHISSSKNFHRKRCYVHF